MFSACESHCKTTNFRLFGNSLIITLPRLMGSNSYFSDIFAYALPSLYCSNTHLKVPEKQNAETSAIIEVVIVVNHLIMCILLVAPGHYLPW